MENTRFALMAIIGAGMLDDARIKLAIVAVFVLALIFIPKFRIFVIALVLIFMLGATAQAVVRVRSCQAGQTCRAQPTYAGPCYPMVGALLTIDSSYFITSESGDAQAKCFDWRVWEDQ